MHTGSAPKSKSVSFYEQSLLIAAKALAFTCFTSSSLHVANYGRQGVGNFSILVQPLLHSNHPDSSDQFGQK